MSAKSANRTQNFSSCTTRKATGTPSLSAPKTADALLEPPSNKTSLPILIFCSCDIVPFRQRLTNGPQARVVIGERAVDAALAKGLTRNDMLVVQLISITLLSLVRRGDLFTMLCCAIWSCPVVLSVIVFIVKVDFSLLRCRSRVSCGVTKRASKN